ncbi:hypothetical protein EK0264_04190 [Epidermidibacterium keratini]|uniref:Uncharacterized protein n=1 Tax=Epidermidibacterium keratini TaxID=1891644 RepID=A0A7L4YL04_9ACTN|nr:hypothetical protein [Epidermidibacterium keratini]QHB99562.1 hypothetical protein EK0264_04190 [Epidermidibacterium keratini]
MFEDGFVELGSAVVVQSAVEIVNAAGELYGVPESFGADLKVSAGFVEASLDSGSLERDVVGALGDFLAAECAVCSEVDQPGFAGIEACESVAERGV